MLKAHMAAVERHLLQISQIPTNSGHPLHKGTPRETFIKEFLTNHLSERVAIGTGEIIDANSKPGQSRNQIDIVIYKRDYPKLDFGGGINGFLVESVVATIEVKSLLTKAEFETATKTAHTLKGLQRHTITSLTSGYQPPSIFNYVVAYDGPASMSTVVDWVYPTHTSLGITSPVLPPTASERLAIASSALDGVFVLGKGFAQFDNGLVSFVNDEIRALNPLMKWYGASTPDCSLLVLFILLTIAVSGMSASWLDPTPYLKSLNIGNTIRWSNG